MKLKLYIYGAISTVLFFLFLYLVFNDLVITFIFILPIGFILFYYLIPIIDNTNTRIKRNESLYFLTNTILSQLKTDRSLTVAFKSIVNYLPEDIKSHYDTYGAAPVDFLELLKDYFNSNYYEIFLNMIKIYDTKGGDIEARSKVLVDAISYSKLIRTELINIKIRKLSEFIIMWLLAFLILVYLRLGLTSYYLGLIETNFVFALVANFILFIISSYYAIASFDKLEETIR